MHVHLGLREVDRVPLLQCVLLAEFYDVLLELLDLLDVDDLRLPDVRRLGGLQEAEDHAVELADEVALDQLEVDLLAGLLGLGPQLDAGHGLQEVGEDDLATVAVVDGEQAGGCHDARARPAEAVPAAPQALVADRGAADATGVAASAFLGLQRLHGGFEGRVAGGLFE